MRLTTLDYAIMGLLLEEPRTGYAIRRMFEETAMGNYSSSPGSIYPSIKKLKGNALITFWEQGNGEVLSTTVEGKDALRAWLVEPITLEDVSKRSEMLLLKFAFMDQLVSVAQTIEFMKQFVELTSQYLEGLRGYMEQEAPQMTLHGRLALEHGIAAVETQLAWAQSTYEFFKAHNNTKK